MSIKKLKTRQEKVVAVQKAQRANEEMPKVTANIDGDVEIYEHEDHLVHFSYIANNFDQSTGKNKGVWVKGQKCYPAEWPNIEKTIQGNSVDIHMIHHPDKDLVKGKKGTTTGAKTPKQEAQSEFADVFGYEPEGSVTIAKLNEAVEEMKQIDEAFGQLAEDGVKIERPVTLEEARAQLEELQSQD